METMRTTMNEEEALEMVPTFLIDLLRMPPRMRAQMREQRSVLDENVTRG